MGVSIEIFATWSTVFFSCSPEDIDKGCSAQLDAVGKGGGVLWENIHVFRTSFRKLDFSAITALRPNYQNAFKAVIELQNILEMTTSRLKDSEESWHLIATDMREKLKNLSDWERSVELEELKEPYWSWLGDGRFLATRSQLGPSVHMLLDTPAAYSRHKRLIASDLIKLRTLVDEQYIRKKFV
ncbi:hypothetical protein [Variovorax sp. E3]|uniref:hypothetical protein n=1 Tax=Variovorax sp. E3 TaxID=1914993 RepID=UPI0018DC866E|nr:hypothetical protein [Variovorax sp. E3]